LDVPQELVTPLPSTVAPLRVWPVRLLTPEMQVDAVPKLIALAQLSFVGCAIQKSEMKINAIRKRDWYNGFCIEKDLDKLKQL
jgi:hypothetical protein